MARKLSRGEIWLHTFKAPDKRRPVLILSREQVLGLLRTAIVAPITSTIHGSPAEVVVGIDEGLKNPSAINLDHVQTVEKSRLHHFVGRVSPAKMGEVCSALAVATGCPGPMPSDRRHN